MVSCLDKTEWINCTQIETNGINYMVDYYSTFFSDFHTDKQWDPPVALCCLDQHSTMGQ